MKLLGPNSLGMFDVHSGLYSTFSSYFNPLWPRTGPVFNLPEGYTCDSPQMRIVDNHWVPACRADRRRAHIRRRGSAARRDRDA